MLFKPGVDRTQTQLAYKLKYFPFASVPSSGRDLVSMRRVVTMTKAQLIEHMDEDACDLYYLQRNWTIVWAYNNVPTEQEWNRLPPNATMLVELRASPAIQGFAVAIILHATGKASGKNYLSVVPPAALDYYQHHDVNEESKEN